MTEVGDVRGAIRGAVPGGLMRRLLAYASIRLRRVGWAHGRDEEASAFSAEQAVQTAIERAIDGSRVWDPSEVDLDGFLRGIIRSITSDERKKYVRAKTITSSRMTEANAGIAESYEDQVVDEEKSRELVAMVETCTGGEPDLRALFGAILDEHTKREDIATALGWRVDRVTAARIKLQRRLVRQRPERFATALEKQRRNA